MHIHLHTYKLKGEEFCGHQAQITVQQGIHDRCSLSGSQVQKTAVYQPTEIIRDEAAYSKHADPNHVQITVELAFTF